MLRRFVLAASLARIPSEAIGLALVLLSVERGVSPAVAGALVGATSLPQLVSGPVMGPRLDATDDVWRSLRRAAVATAACTGVLVAAVDPAPAALVVAFAAAGIVAWFEPVFTGGISAAADRTGIDARRAHAWDSLSYNLAGLAAPLAVTALAVTAGPAAALAAVGGCVAVAGMVTLGLVDRRSADPAASTSRPSHRRAVADAAAAIAREAGLRRVTVATTLSFAAFGSATFAAVAAARATGRDPAAAGVMFTVLAVGGVIGSLTMTRRPAPAHPESMVGASLAVIGAAWAAAAFVANWPAVLVAAFVVGVLDGPLLVGVFATRTRRAPAVVRTTVFTLGASAKLGASAIGATAGGLLLGDRATMAGLAVIGVVHLVAGAACLVGGRAGVGVAR